MARTLNNEVDILNIASLDNDIKDSFTRAMISEDVNTTSAAARKYLEGEYFIHNDRCLYKALEEIAAGTTITPDVNAEVVTVSEELVRLFAQSPEGIFEVISNVQDSDTATRSFVKGEQIIWKDKQLYNVTADVVSGGTWTVGTNIDLADNLTSQIRTLTNNNYAMLHTLGAKNMLPNNATTQIINGVTFTVNSNGTVRAARSSASQDNSWLTIAENLVLPSGNYILNRCPTGGGSNTYGLVFDSDIQTSPQYCYGEYLAFTVTEGEKIRIRIRISSSFNSSVLIPPMIRPAAVIDSTYVPYAMTNRELTDFASEINSISRVDKTTSSSLGNNSWGNVCSKTLTAGTYLVIAQNEFGGNSNGRRGTGIGTSSVIVKYGRVFVAAPDNNTFSMQYVTVITLTETTVITNQAIQSSGTTIDHLNGSLIAIKLS